MHVKVFCGDKNKIVRTTRTATYEELLTETLKEFEMPDAKRENCRLRSYNVPNQTMQETYTSKDKSTLEDLRIYPQKTLVLEIKKDGEVFEEFDPTQIQVKINVWRPGIIVLEEAALKPQKLSVKKTANVDALISAVSSLAGIPKDRLLYVPHDNTTGRIGKRLPMGSAQCVEIISGKENAEKTLAHLRVNEGINLFVEDSAVVYPASEDFGKLLSAEKKCKWEIVSCDEITYGGRSTSWKRTGTR